MDKRARAYEAEGMGTEYAYARAYGEVNAMRVRRMTREKLAGLRDREGYERRRYW